jgi:hypothetical protein
MSIAKVPGRRPMSEAQIQGRLMAKLRWSRWRVVHFRPAVMRSGKWATPYEGDGGFPDIIAARYGEALALEVKGPRTPIQPGQPEWIELFDSVPGMEAQFVYEADLPAIEERIARPPITPS